MINKRYLTVGEVADELRVTTRTVERWVSMGYLLSFMIGGTRRIDRNDLLLFIRRAKQAMARKAAQNRSMRRKRTIRRRAARPYARGPRLPE